jgi:hypothetical protein
VVKDQHVDDPGDANGGRLPDVVAETTMLADPLEGAQRKDESYRAMALQVFIPFLVAGLGMVGAGLVLDIVQVTHTKIGNCNILCNTNFFTALGGFF